MKPIQLILAAAVIATLATASAQAQINNNPPGAPGARRGGGGSVDAGPGRTVLSPEVNTNNSVTFRLQAPNAKFVRVVTDIPKVGDLPHGSAGFDLKKDDTGIWSYTTAPLKPSYYQYWFIMDAPPGQNTGGLVMPDPMNTFVRPASGVYKSIVAVPGKEAEFMMFRDVPHGDLIEHHYLNPDNKTARRVVIYTPPDYSTSGKSYPVLYLLHGANDYERGWTQTGMANTIMDNLIADGKAVPAIIVMPFGHDTTGSTGKLPEVRALQQSLGYAPAGRGARGAGGRGAPAGAAAPSYMEKDLLGIVMPYVEKEFRVIKDKNHRAIFGYSMGGGHSTSIGFGHPELFAYVGGFSGYNGPQTPTTARLLEDPAKANKDYKMIFIGSGTEDTAVNGGRTLHEAFVAKGINHTWSEDPGYGHDYQIWRQYLYRLLQQTFRD